MFKPTLYLLGALAAGATLNLTALESYEKAGLPEFIVGGCVHFGQGKSIPVNNLTMMKNAGFNSIRDEVYWGGVEQQKGKLVIPGSFLNYVREAAQRNIMPLVILDYGNVHYDKGGYPTSPEAIEGYIRYCETVVKATDNQTRLYQIWNEWDGGCGMPNTKPADRTPAKYVKLLAATYPRLKAVDPQAIVVSNSVCTGDAYLEETLKLGLVNYCDVVALHTYNYGNGSPENTPEKWYERMLNVREMLRKYNNGKDKPMYITEMGYPNHISNSGSSYDTTAANIARIYLLAKTLPFLKGFWWYDFQDDGWDYRYNEDNFGIVRPDLTPKPAYNSIRSISDLIVNGRFLERIDVGNPAVYLLKYELKGKTVLAMWSADPANEAQLLFENQDGKLTPVEVQLAGQLTDTKPWGYRAWVENRNAPLIPNQLSFTVNGLPLLVTGDLDQVSFKQLTLRAFPQNDRPQNVRLRLPKTAAIATAKATTPRTLNFGHAGNYIALNGKPYQGGADFNSDFSLQYDRDNLYLTVTVQDNQFFQDETIENAWMGDGLQLAFQVPGDQVKYLDRTELDVALTPQGPLVLLRAAQTGEEPKLLDLKPSIERKGDKTIYSLAIPAKLLGLKAFESGSMFAFSLLVNENDGDGRVGFLQWGAGIGFGGKDPGLYNLVICD